MRTSHKRYLSFLLSLLLIFSGMGNLFADIIEPVEKIELNSGSNLKRDELIKRFPLSAEYLNREIVTKELAEKIFILQFEDGREEYVLNKLKQIDGLEIKYHYDSIFKGVSVKVRSDLVGKIRDIEGIKNIQENGTFAPQMISAKQLTRIKEAVDYNENLIKNLPEEERAKRKLDGRGTIVAVIDSGIDIGHEAMKIDPEARPFMKYKNIDKGFTEKVPHGFSYVGGGQDLMDKVIAGHGMHCSGIIAGNSDTFKGVVPNAQLFSYRIFSDQYYGEDEDSAALYEFGGDDSVYHAIDDAVKNGADVISMSIGQAGNGYVGDLYYETVNRAAEKGVVVVSAIGNYSSSSSENTFDDNPLNNIGLTDTSAMTYYSGIGRILAVGSVKNTFRESSVIQIGDEKFPYTSLGSFAANENAKKTNIGDSEFVFVGHGRDSAYNGLDVKGKVVIALRDGARIEGSRIAEKIKIAKAKEAKGIIVLNAPISYSRDVYMDYPITSYENDEEMSDLISDGKLWAISLNGADGEKLKKLVKTGTFNVSFPADKMIARLAEEPRVSGFSGWGPNAELELKPEVVAPGENVYSTMNRDRYGIMSGTSMATPHVSGVSAMLVQKVNQIVENPYFKELGKSDTNKILIMNTAEPLKDYIKTDLEVSPRRQGAGMIRADKALMNEVLVTYNKKGAVELKDFKNDVKSFKVRLDNLSSEDKTYDVEFSKVLGEGVVEQEKLLLKPDKIQLGDFTDTFGTEKVKTSVPIILPNSSITSNQNQITVPANSKVELELTLRTTGISDAFVEGYIYFNPVNGSNYPKISIPYLGYKGDWQKGRIIDKPMWDDESVYKHTTVVGLYPDDGHGDDIEYKILGVDKDAFPSSKDNYGRIIVDEEHLKEGYMVDPDKISFSVGFMAANPKQVTLRMVALREVKDLEVSILDKDKNVVRVVSRSQNYRKQIHNVIYESSWQAKVFHRPNVLFTWDGKLYNKKTGKMDLAPSGQYYYRVRAKVKDTDEYEETILPVKLDNTEPRYKGANYVISKDGKTRDVTFNISDDHSLMFVGASLDNKPVEVKKISENEYKIENLKINELTRSRLHIEAMDYATNLMEPVEIDLNQEFMNIENQSKVVSGEEKVLKALINNSKVSKIEAIQNDKHLIVDKKDSSFEINLENNSENIVILAKDMEGNVIGEKLVKLSVEVTKPEVAQSHELGATDYEKMSDDESSKFRRALNYGLLNYYIVTSNSPLISESNGKFYFNPSGGWFISFWDRYSQYGFKLEDYDLKATAYNILEEGHEDYQPTWNLEVNADNVPYEPNISVYDGTNILNLTFVEKSTGKIIFSRGVLIMLDTEDPELSLDEGNVDLSNKKVYANSDTVTLKGSIRDNLDEVYLSLNGDNIVTKLKQGDFGNTETQFEASVEVKDDDILTFLSKDRFGNSKEIQYKVVMDTEAPTIEFEENLNKESVLNVKINDNIGLRANGKMIFVNGKPYVEGTQLKEYSEEEKYFIEIKAIDKAGNITEKELELGLEESDKKIEKITLIKSKFTKEEVSDFTKFIQVPESYQIVRVSDIDIEKTGIQTVKVIVKNKYGISAEFDFEITVVEDSGEVDLNSIVLKKSDFLPEELKESNLFDLPAGVIVEIKKIDASIVGEQDLEVKFIYNGKELQKKFRINILPELSLKLQKTQIPVNEIKDISKYVKQDDRFAYSFVEEPTEKLGIQTIKILIKDKFGNQKEVAVDIQVIAQSTNQSSDSGSSSGSGNSSGNSSNTSINEDKKDIPKDSPKKEDKNDDSKKALVLKDIKGHWAEDIILKAIEEEMVKGYPDNTFKPDGSTKRSEFITLANRIFKYKTIKIIKFPDVDFGVWYEKDLSALSEKGIIKGDSTGNFLPESLITREEISAILIRYIENEYPDVLKIEMKELGFKDKDDISDWAKDSVIKAYSVGLLQGDNKNMINAKKLATRAEVLKMIYNLKNITER